MNIINRIYFPGVFDLLHVGHLKALQNVARAGDLIVGVCSDHLNEKLKGETPIFSLSDRMRLLSSLKYVKAVVPYDNTEYVDKFNKVGANIFACSPEFGKDPTRQDQIDFLQWCEDNYIPVIVTPPLGSFRDDSKSTSGIIKKIQNEHAQIHEDIEKYYHTADYSEKCDNPNCFVCGCNDDCDKLRGGW